MHALLFGRLHGPVEHPAALGLGPLDPPHEPGHADHHQHEQHRPGAGDGHHLDLAAAEPLEDQQGRGDQGGRPHGQQPAPAQAGLAPPRRLRQPGHRRVQPGRAHEHVVHQVHAVGDGRGGAAEGEHREQRVGGRGHGQAGDQQPDGGRAPPRGGGQPGRLGEQEHVSDRVGQRHQQLDHPERREGSIPSTRSLNENSASPATNRHWAAAISPPGQPPERPVAAQADGDRGRGRGADDHVQDGPGGVVGQQVVGSGRERADAQIDPPGGVRHPSQGRRARAPV